MFDIKISGKNKLGEMSGSILLNSNTESFQMSNTFFSADDYIRQWRDAVHLCLNNGTISALFSSVEVNDSGYGRLWIYTLIPASEAIMDEGKKPKSGVYLTQQFLHITTNAKNLEKSVYLKTDDGNDNSKLEIPVYFFDTTNPNRIFCYLSGSICGISHWYYDKNDLAKFIAK